MIKKVICGLTILLSVIATENILEAEMNEFICPVEKENETWSYDIFGQDVEYLRLLRNSIFACYGYDFKDEELKKYFMQYMWYIPRSDFSTNDMSEGALKTVQYLKEYEELFEKQPDEILFFDQFSVYGDKLSDLTYAYCRYKANESSGIRKYEDVYVLSIIPGILSSNEEVSENWNKDVYKAEVYDASTITAGQIRSCRLVAKNKNEPHLCVELSGPSDDYSTLFIGWQGERFGLTGHIHGGVKIILDEEQLDGPTLIIAHVYRGFYDLKERYLYDPLSESIEYIDDIYPAKMDEDCHVYNERIPIAETVNDAVQRNYMKDKFYYKGEYLRVVEMDCIEGGCAYMTFSHDRPNMKGWVPGTEHGGMGCGLPYGD